MLTKMQCEYCGAEPSQIITGSRHRGNYIYNGIDRIDNKLGYIKGNVVPCCWQCNKSKADMSRDMFITWAKNVAARYT